MGGSCKSSNYADSLVHRLILLALPDALTTSADYVALSKDQARAFGARLAHCAELAEVVRSHATIEPTSLRQLVDDIELDVTSLLSNTSDLQEGVSVYRVHSSWTFECDRARMPDYISADALKVLQQPSFSGKLSSGEIHEWLMAWACALKDCLCRLSLSIQFTDAVTQVIVIDALLASALVFSSGARLCSPVME